MKPKIICKRVYLDGPTREPTEFYLNENLNWCFARKLDDACIFWDIRSVFYPYREAIQQADSMFLRDGIVRQCYYQNVTIDDDGGMHLDHS